MGLKRGGPCFALMFGTVSDLERTVQGFEDSLTRLLDLTQFDRQNDASGNYRARLVRSLRNLQRALWDAFELAIGCVERTSQTQGVDFDIGRD